MAAKPETTFTAGVHRHLPSSLYRMKTHNPYVGGIPDCYYSGQLNDLWVEYKYIPKLTPAQCRLPNLSALQVDWINGRCAEGRSVVVIVGCPDGGVVLADGDWETFLTPQQFKDRVQTRKEIADWITGFTQGGP